MARDINALERIETILYHFGVPNSGEVAKQIYEEEVKHLEDQIESLVQTIDELLEDKVYDNA